MKKIFKIFKLLIIILLISLTIWFYNTENTIIASIGKYKIYTSFFSITIILIVLLILYYCLIFPLLKLQRKIIFQRRTKKILKLMSIFNIHEEKEILTLLVSNLEQKNDIKIIRNTKILIMQANYDKAMSYIRAHKVSKNFFFIQEYYLCIAYAAKKETNNLIATLEQAITYCKNYNFWFLKILVKLNQKNPVLSQLIFLHKKFDLIKFPSKQKKKKYFCILMHLLVENLIKENNLLDAQLYVDKLIDTYPDYTPIYEFYFTLNKNEISDKKMISVLEKAWLNQPSYLSIRLWIKYFDTENIDLEKTLKHLCDKTNIPQYNLLLASLYIKQNHLIKASEYLEQSKLDSIDKLLVEIALLAKERDYKKLMSCINDLATYSKQTYWWN